jgi:hypothetical protein
MEGLHASLRASQVPTFRVMEVMKAAHERERRGGKVLHMEVGQPSVGAPSAVLEAAKASLDACGRGETTLGYTVADGTDALVRDRCYFAPRGAVVRVSVGVMLDDSSVEVQLGHLLSTCWLRNPTSEVGRRGDGGLVD